MRPVIPELRDPPSLRARVAAIAALAIALTAPPAALWAAGSYRHHQDAMWCSTGIPDRDAACVARREGRRWGPFLAFGRSANHSSD